MENKLGNLDQRVSTIENSCSFISNEFDAQKDQLAQTQAQLKTFESKYATIKKHIEEYDSKEELINEKLVDLESRSMRENLMFYGIPETNDTANENCETLVKTLIQDVLKIDTQTMVFDRVHRIGPKGNRGTRPIVAKFHRYNDRETVRQKSFDTEIKAEMTKRNIGVGVQWPQQIREARKALHPLAKEAESRREKTRMVGNKLYINN